MGSYNIINLQCKGISIEGWWKEKLSLWGPDVVVLIHFDLLCIQYFKKHPMRHKSEKLLEGEHCGLPGKC